MVKLNQSSKVLIIILRNGIKEKLYTWDEYYIINGWKCTKTEDQSN